MHADIRDPKEKGKGLVRVDLEYICENLSYLFSLLERPHYAALVSAVLLQDDLEKIESTTPFRNGTILVRGNETEIHEFEFGPIEHPIEPLDEDHPVKFPMLNSSVLNNGSMQDEGFSGNLNKLEQKSRKEPRFTDPATEAPTLKTLRKRHHTQTSVEDHTCSPFLNATAGSFNLQHASAL